MLNYKVLLQAKNEGLSYEDESGIYRFNLSRQNKIWIVHLPPTKGNNFVTHLLSNQEQELLYPRISKYLSRIWWFGVWPVNYGVQFGV